MVNVLGISCYYHDAAATLIKDGVVVAAAEEERFSRRKHDNGFPTHAIDFCLEKGKIKTSQIDYVVFYEKPFVKFERIILSTLQTWPNGHAQFREGMLNWLKNKMWIASHIASKLKIGQDKILFSDHHVSHAASAFLCSPFEDAAIVTVDGVGEWTTATIGVGEGNEVKILKELKFPHSVGLLYSVYTAFLGFEVNEGEYKVMGMAPYGQPKHTDKVWKTLKMNEDGSIALNMEYFKFHRSENQSYSKKFVELFGKPRDPNAGEEIEEYYADVAASIQKVTEDIMVKIVEYAKKLTGKKNLCMAGGVALNSKANGIIMKNKIFDDIFIQPAAGDSGGSMGAALYAYHTLLGNKKRHTLTHAYYGEEYSKKDIKEFLDGSGIEYQYMPNEGELLESVANRIKNEGVIGWFQGRFEWGPRALGNRSIVADARSDKMKDIVNRKIKFREPFRPFAPSVLVDSADRFFEIENPESHYPARFMLYVVPVKGNMRSVIPAVTHVDGTARLQTVYKTENPRYYGLIEKFGELTGVDTVLNTSFNLKGEPIVNTPENAYSTFSRSEMDTLVLENFIIDKNAK